MRIRRVTLRNFGLYRGEQTFDLLPRPQRPIVLIGGRNGAGKTTLLEAIRVCLYGRIALGHRVAESEYQAYTRDHLHKSRDGIPATYASVAVEFDYSQFGEVDTYVVRRAWERRGGSTAVTEALQILRNGQPLSEVEAQLWPEFIRNLVPPGVSQLFFFDGEKIKRLAEEDEDSATLAEAVRGLLGFDLIEQLEADLEVYASRSVRKAGVAANVAELERIEAEKAEATEKLDKLKTDSNTIEGRLKDIAEQISKKERELAERGEAVSLQRGDLRERINVSTIAIDHNERSLRDLFEGPLPIALCPSLARQALIQLECERDTAHRQNAAAHLDSVIELVTADIAKGAVAPVARLSGTTRTALAQAVRELAQKHAGPTSENVQIIHHLSDLESERVRQSIREGLGAASTQAVQLSNKINAETESLRQTTSHLNRAPESDEIEPIVRALSTLQEEHAKASLDKTVLGEEIPAAERAVEKAEREKARLLEKEAKARKLSDKLAVAQRVRSTLATYRASLSRQKLAELEHEALSCFVTLCRKKDLVSRIAIDPNSLAVELSDPTGQPLPKSSLSAGEKQLYAVGLLWALAKVARRPLPVIIDTPLGRLDSHHRRTFLTEYLPAVSHQVIVLSTDTEVEADALELIKDKISHCVLLRTNEAGGTEIADGYFGTEADREYA